MNNFECSLRHFFHNFALGIETGYNIRFGKQIHRVQKNLKFEFLKMYFSLRGLRYFIPFWPKTNVSYKRFCEKMQEYEKFNFQIHISFFNDQKRNNVGYKLINS